MLLHASFSTRALLQLIAVAGAPYDTMEEVIGLRGKKDLGSLKDLGVSYREVGVGHSTTRLSFQSSDPEPPELLSQISICSVFDHTAALCSRSMNLPK